MAILLFKLTHVPDDEAAEVRALLDEAEIHYYETDAGFWRVGLDAIWLANGEQETHARELMEAYQATRTSQQRQLYGELQADGRAPNLWQKFCESPLRFVGFILIVVFILALTLLPFLLL